MGQATVEAMEKSFGSQPKDLLCAIGPSICQDCYEVSRDVAEAFIFAFPTHEKEILQAGALGKYQLDLWKANEIVLTEGFVPAATAVFYFRTEPARGNEEIWEHF